MNQICPIGTEIWFPTDGQNGRTDGRKDGLTDDAKTISLRLPQLLFAICNHNIRFLLNFVIEKCIWLAENASYHSENASSPADFSTRPVGGALWGESLVISKIHSSIRANKWNFCPLAGHICFAILGVYDMAHTCLPRKTEFLWQNSTKTLTCLWIRFLNRYPLFFTMLGTT